MMKKRMAAFVTAGVLALSMLTGCGRVTVPHCFSPGQVTDLPSQYSA